MTYQRTIVFKVIPLLLALGSSGCGQWLGDETTGDSAHTMATAPKARVHATYITFTKWNDYVQLDAATERVGDACKFLAPLTADDTTRWKPLQLYWVIVDNANDATLGAEIANTYFDGDSVKATEFDAQGFAGIKEQYASMLPLSGQATSADGSVLSGTLGNPFNAALKLTTAPEGEGCVTQATYCRTTSADCSVATNFGPLKAIHVKQNLFGAVSNVTFE